MKVEKAVYKGVAIRYAIVSKNGILFNLTDVCTVLGISDRPAENRISRSCLNIAGVMEAALTKGKYEIEFVEWLENNFVGYDLQTSVKDDCDDQWEMENDGKSFVRSNRLRA